MNNKVWVSHSLGKIKHNNDYNLHNNEDNKHTLAMSKIGTH